jgi:hypothetical protein
MPRRAAVPLPGHHQPASRVRHGREGLEQRAQSLALEARAHEEHGPRLVGNAQRLARLPAVAAPVVGMEALEIDPVVDERHPLRIGAVPPLDLLLALARDRDHVARRAEPEDPALEGQDQAVVRVDARELPPHRLEVGAVAALARTIEILSQRALVTLHEVVAVAPRRGPSRHREGDQPERGGMPQRRHAAHDEAGHRRLPSRADQLDVVAGAAERAEEARGRGLDTAVEGERPADEAETHQRPIRRARSTRGKSARRADSKL